MNKIYVVVLIVALSVAALAKPAGEKVSTVRNVNENDGSGNYEFIYELDNGQIVAEQGRVDDKGVLTVMGKYSYVGPNGNTYWANYIADENGFHPITGTGVGGVEPGERGYGDGEDLNALKRLVG